MSSDRLDNLVRTGQLKKEPPRADELVGLRRSGLAATRALIVALAEDEEE